MLRIHLITVYDGANNIQFNSDNVGDDLCVVPQITHKTYGNNVGAAFRRPSDFKE